MSAATRWERVLGELRRKRRPKLSDFLEALDAINPTPHELSPAETEARYHAKSDVQTKMIAAYGADLELRQDGEQWLLAVRGGRDAKHVVRHQLGEPAQAWFSNELLRLHVGEGDEGDAAPAAGQSVPSPATPQNDPLDALLDVGDYEGAIGHLTPAARSGDARAGSQILELVLDYLDEPLRAVQQVESWPSALAEHVAIRGLFAVALARTGRFDDAESRAQRIDGPSSARAWEELLRFALRDGDHGAAARFADRLEAADPSRLHVVDAARAEVDAAIASALAPRLADLDAAVAAGEWAQVEGLARDILDEAPDTPRAREALAIAEARRREKAASEAYAQGERLSASGRPKAAARAFGRAAALGHSDGRHRQQVELGNAEELDRARALDAAARAAEDGDLLPYLDLDEAGRTTVRERAASASRLLDWLDECPSGHPRDRVALAHALVRAEGQLEADRPAEALDTLQQVARSVERNRAAKLVLREATDRERALRVASASRSLQAAADAVDGPVEELRARLEAVEVGWLDPTQRQQQRKLEARLLARVSDDEKVRRFERLLESEPVAAWRLARRQEGARWRERASAADVEVQRVHRVHAIQEPIDARDLAVPRSWARPLATLDADTVTLTETAGPFTSVAVVDCETLQVRRGLQFWLPGGRALRVSPPDADGTSWIGGYACAVQVDLSERRVLDVRQGTRGANALAAEPTPSGVFWRGLRGTGWTFRDLQGREASIDGDYRELAPMVGVTGAVARRVDGTVVYLDGADTAFPIARIDMDSLLAASVHPTDRSTVIVYHRGDEVVVASIGRMGRVRDVFRDRLHARTEMQSVTVAVSKVRGRFFVLWPIDDVSFSLIVLDGEGRRVGEGTVRAPCSLAMDAEARNCALLYRSSRGFGVHRLDQDVVELRDEAPSLEYPRIDNFCEPRLDGPTEEIAMHVEFDDGTLDAEVERRTTEASGPEELLRITVALVSRFPTRGLALAERLGLQTHPHVAFLGASQLVEDGAVERAATLLESVQSERLPESWLEHYHHVRGVLALCRGDVEEAQAAFREGSTCGASCGLDRWSSYAAILARSAPDAVVQPGAAGVWQQVRGALVAARSRLAEGDLRGAWQAVASGPVSWLPFDEPQMMRARVILDGVETSRWTRCRVLGYADDRFSPRAYLPEALPEAEAEATHLRARMEGEPLPKRH